MSATYATEDGQKPLEELRVLPEELSATTSRLRRRWVGHPDRILAQRQALINAGGYTRLSVKETGSLGLHWQLDAEVVGEINPNTGLPIIGNAAEVSTVWTSEPSLISASLWYHPVWVADYNRIPTNLVGLNNRRRIRDLINYLVQGEYQIPDATNPTVMLPLTVDVVVEAAVTAGMTAKVVRDFVETLLSGATSYQPEVWALRRSRRVPPGNSFKESRDRVGRMLRFSTLKSAEGFNEAELATSLPTNGYWKKMAPSDHPAGDGSREVVTDFQWAEEYPRFMFGPPV